MQYESIRTTVQKLSAQLRGGVEFFAVAYSESGGPIKLIGPFKVLERRGDCITFIDIEDVENIWGDPQFIEVAIIDLVLAFDKVVPIRPRHSGTPQKISCIEIRVEKK